jgi:hypothetical protein
MMIELYSNLVFSVEGYFSPMLRFRWIALDELNIVWDSWEHRDEAVESKGREGEHSKLISVLYWYLHKLRIFRLLDIHFYKTYFILILMSPFYCLQIGHFQIRSIVNCILEIKSIFT